MHYMTYSPSISHVAWPLIRRPYARPPPSAVSLPASGLVSLALECRQCSRLSCDQVWRCAELQAHTNFWSLRSNICAPSTARLNIAPSTVDRLSSSTCLSMRKAGGQVFGLYRLLKGPYPTVDSRSTRGQKRIAGMLLADEKVRGRKCSPATLPTHSQAWGCLSIFKLQVWSYRSVCKCESK